MGRRRIGFGLKVLAIIAVACAPVAASGCIAAAAATMENAGR